MSGFSDRIAAIKQQGSTARARVADVFVAPAAGKEPRQMLTIRVPVSMHERLRRTAFETNVSMQDQLIQGLARSTRRIVRVGKLT